MNELERHFCDQIGEDPDTPDVFTEGSESLAMLRGSLNDAVDEISMVTGSVKRTYHLPLRAKRNFHRIPSIQGTIAWISSIWTMENKRRLEQTSFLALNDYNPRWLYNTGPPERYFLLGTGVIGIHPAPSSTTDMADITAVIIPENYKTDTERVQLRNDFKWGAINYAVSEYYASRGDARSATKHFFRYAELLGLSDLYPAMNDRVWSFKSSKEPSTDTSRGNGGIP